LRANRPLGERPQFNTVGYAKPGIQPLKFLVGLWHGDAEPDCHFGQGHVLNRQVVNPAVKFVEGVRSDKFLHGYALGASIRFP
jgi:hypothetical protein